MTIIPLEVPVQVASNITVNASSSATVATFQLPAAARSFSLQAEVAEARGTIGGEINFEVNFGLDGVNYPWGVAVGVNGITAPWFFTLTESSISPVYYIQLYASNTDSVNHTLDNVWMVFK